MSMNGIDWDYFGFLDVKKDQKPFYIFVPSRLLFLFFFFFFWSSSEQMMEILLWHIPGTYLRDEMETTERSIYFVIGRMWWIGLDDVRAVTAAMAMGGRGELGYARHHVLLLVVIVGWLVGGWVGVYPWD